MPLEPGTRLGPYEIVGPLGAGGMGEVYQARDTRLDRGVAVKVLPPHLTHNPERRARFDREAKAVSALNHPHICTLYDVGHERDTDYLVMELVEGETLAERLSKGPLPLEQTLRTAIEVASALDKAHRQGVIHRDLKPGNVVLTKVGAKLMDFGLAKRALAEEDSDHLTALPTEAPLTSEGTLLGTMAYMAPEQLEGREADARSDLWAFGCLLYEMATGRRAFEGKSQANLIGAILTVDPQPIAQLQPQTPTSLDRLVKVCLAKDPDNRLQTAHDVAQELKWIAEGVSGGLLGALARPTTTRRMRLGWGLLGLAAALLAGAAGAAMFIRAVDRRAGAGSGVSRVRIEVGPAEELRDLAGSRGRLARTAIALSPDGRSLVFAGVRDGQQQLYLRPLDQLDATSIAGTEGGIGPFFSPDGKWLGFWASGELRKLPLSGGPPVTLCKALLPYGATWAGDDRIVFGQFSGALLQVDASGGSPEELTSLDIAAGEVSHRLPHAVPGSDVVLFTATRNRSPSWSDTQVVAYSRSTRARNVVVEGGADARYVASGHLAYVREGTLMAAPFDRTRAVTTGGPVGILPDVMQAAYEAAATFDSGAGQFAVSLTGTLAYVAGGVVPEPRRTLVWVDRRGHEEPVPLPAKAYFQPRISPDGRKIVVATLGRNLDVWAYEIGRQVLARLTTEGRYATPVWSPDGARIVYCGARAGPDNLFWRPVDGSAATERLTTNPRHQVPASWSPDGTTLLFYDLGPGLPGSVTALWDLELNGDRQSKPLVTGPSSISGADLSPDGQWIAYASDPSGQSEVYVQPYGRAGASKQVSTSGGMSPVWRRDGRELSYIVRDGAGPQARLSVMTVAVTSRPTFTAGTPVKLFEGSYGTNAPARSHDVTPDGRRFLFVREQEASEARLTRVILVQNWFEELRRRVPSR